MIAPVRVALLNPNSSAATTVAMLMLARAEAPPEMVLTGFTADRTPPVLTRPSDVEDAADWVGAMLPGLAEAGYAAVLVSAFGDPGVDRHRPTSPIPIVGIGEVGMTAAAAGGRRFAIVTTTPDLGVPITARAAALGFGDRLVSVRITAGDPLEVMGDDVRLVRALAEIAIAAVEIDGAEAVLIGGGPLGPIAAALARRVAIPVIEPVAAGVAHLAERLGLAVRRGPTAADARRPEPADRPA